MSPETEVIVRQILWGLWTWLVKAIDWVINQPKENLVAFIGIAVLFFMSNLLVRSAIKSWPVLIAAGRHPSEELVPMLFAMHSVVFPFLIAAALHFVWHLDLKFLAAKLIAVLVLLWVFAISNFLAVRTSSLLGRVVWTIVGLIIVPITYLGCIWVLLQAPISF